MSARRRAVNPIASFSLALESVRLLGERRRALENETRQMLLAAYATGVVSWTQLGAALGVTGSVAWHLAHPSGTAEGEPAETG